MKCVIASKNTGWKFLVIFIQIRVENRPRRLVSRCIHPFSDLPILQFGGAAFPIEFGILSFFHKAQLGTIARALYMYVFD